MALHSEFPTSAYEKLLPPLVAKIREEVTVGLRAYAASATETGTEYKLVYVDQAGFEKYPPKDFAGLAASFTDYQAD